MSDTQRIHMGVGRIVIPAPATNATDGPMGLSELQTNFGRIVAASTIHYPVAFRLQRELGRGRQGRVYLGLRHGARGCVTEYAIKVFDPALYRNTEEYWTDMGRIADQVSRMQRLYSPNLAASHSYDETLGIGLLTMEAVDGLDLERLRDPGHLAVARARCGARGWARLTRALFRQDDGPLRLQPGLVVHILRGALRGLERLHEAGFLHADVKPGNIMLDRLGYPKVVDFGRAVRVGEAVTFLLGSPLYMAPEAHRREPGRVQSDLYSLGLVALELLRGERLNERPDANEDALYAAKLDLPARLEGWLPSYVRENERLVGILRRLLDPDPTRRFASAREAEVGEHGLVVVDKQLIKANLDAEYERDLAAYFDKLADPGHGRVDWRPTGA